MAIKDDEKLLDEALANMYADIVSFDRARAERVLSLIIRRHRESSDAFKALLNDLSKRRRERLDLRIA
jgi:ribulose bisphosphate carboxylase small subunit